jgi:hypothetical protein
MAIHLYFLGILAQDILGGYYKFLFNMGADFLKSKKD